MQNKSRAGILLGVSHEWSRPILLDYSFRTDIRTSRSGIEQREATRENPRVTVSINLKDWGGRRHRLHDDIIRDQNTVVYLPLPWRRRPIEDSDDLGQPSLFIGDPLPAWAAVGAYVLIESRTTQEVGRIGATGLLGQIDLVENISLTPGRGAFVYHALPCRVAEEATFRYMTDSVLQGNLSLTVIPGFEGEVDQDLIDFPPDRPDYVLYQGRPVLMLKPNWRQGLQVTLSRDRDTVDFGFGRTQSFSPVEFSRTASRMQFTFRSVEDAERFQTFFRNRRGRRSAFWCPTWTDDFDLSAAQGGPTSLRVVGTDAASTFNGSPTHRFIVARWPDESYQFNRVVSVSAGTEVSDFTMQSPWSRSVLSAKALHWLLPVRFAADNLSMTWLTPTVAETTASVVSVPLAEFGIA
jgi:hypothetical protein